MQVRSDNARHTARTAPAVSGGNSHVLFATDSECQREAFDSGAQSSLPQNLAGIDVEGAEHAVQITHERHPSRRRHHASEERRALFVLPQLAHGPYIVSRQLADISVRPRHLKEAPQSAAAAAATLNFCDRLSVHL